MWQALLDDCDDIAERRRNTAGDVVGVVAMLRLIEREQYALHDVGDMHLIDREFAAGRQMQWPPGNGRFQKITRRTLARIIRPIDPARARVNHVQTMCRHIVARHLLDDEL